MKISIDTHDPTEIRTALLVIPVTEFASDDEGGVRVPSRLRSLDRKLGGALDGALATGDFRGGKGQSLVAYPGEGQADRVVLLGVGPAGDLDAEALRGLAGRGLLAARLAKAEDWVLALPPGRRPRPEESVAALGEGALLAAYRFDAYKSERPKNGATPKRLRLAVGRAGKPAELRRALREATIVAESQNVARDLSNQPANELPPAALGREARRVARQAGLQCRVLDVPSLEKLGMGALLAVGRGSRNDPRLIVLDHRPSRKRGVPTVCLVGKGITFDTGGISIKPSPAMDKMKHDMSGAAAVVGTLRACALLDLPVRVVGLLAAAENMPGGDAYRPSDVVRSMSGKTIEILNTDAEGRVVLADALHYAEKNYSPEAIVDVATLTGACIIALGSCAAGLFTRDEALCGRLQEAAERSGERVWPLPLLDEHVEGMRSQVADLRNAGAREAGASMAAGFLSAFVREAPWAHLDIAGTADTEKVTPVQPRGATGYGVRLLVEFVRGWAES